MSYEISGSYIATLARELEVRRILASSGLEPQPEGI